MKSKVVKHKDKTQVLTNALQAQCSCDWKGTVLSTKSSLDAAIKAAQKERSAHLSGGSSNE